MKLLELQLLAFGPFTDVSLAFSNGPGLHLIYGPNEAGKSTALRAITGLLFGIPPTTGDAHLHRTTDLRIGAQLANGRRSLAVVRRKGNKNTLLDTEGAALPDDALDDFLCGVDEATFGAMFGLDHESLRRGAEALLRGRGNVGESLFDAGVGGRGIQALLDELTLEGDALYRPRGQTQKINEGLRELREAQKRRAGAELSADAWQTQLDAIESDRGEREQVASQLRLLAAEESSLRRGLRVRPLVAQLRDLRAQRAALGEVEALAADARERRLDAQRVAEECERQAERLRAEIAKRVAEAEEVTVAEELAGLEESFVDELRNRLGEQRKAAEDLPKRKLELEALSGEVSLLTERLSGDAEKFLTGARLPLGLEERIGALANERSGVRAELDQARRHLAERQSKMKLLREQLAASSARPADVQALRRTLGAAEQVAEEPARLANLRRRWERERDDIESGAPGMGFRVSDMGELRALSLPAPEVVERVATRVEAAERECAENEERARKLEERERENRRGRAALENVGAVPSEESLEEARQQRERRWGELRSRLRTGLVEEEDLREYEARVRVADELSDRLRREAGRVESRARLLAEDEALRSEGDALQRRIKVLAAERQAAQHEWSDLWSDLVADVGPPAQMRGWLRRAEELLARVRRAEELREQVDETESLLRERCAALRRELLALGATEEAVDDLATLIADARAEVERVAEVSRREEDGRRALEELRQQTEASRRELAEREGRLREWESAWRESVSVLTLDEKATPQEVAAVLRELTTLDARLDEMRRMEKRVAALEADSERFAADVAAYARSWAPSLVGVPPPEMAEKFLRLQRQAAADLRHRDQLRREIAERTTALNEQEERLAAARRDLDALLVKAGAADLRALEECERLSAEATSLNVRIADLEEKLLSVGEGASLEELMEQAGAIDPDSASARLREVEVLMQELAERQSVLDNQIGGSLRGLEYMRRERGASDAAAEVEEKLAALDEHVRRYVRVKLAIAMLDREIERYRQENQDPVLRRAGELFPRLTLGRYTALRVGYGSKDEAVLLCVRQDGVEVDVEGLSDGTRDQLYLALRLATLEKFAESNDSMPLVLDDVLIHFDDDRARAAFDVLGEFASKFQVLFFTHNARLVDLAREVIPSGRLVEHGLLEGVRSCLPC